MKSINTQDWLYYQHFKKVCDDKSNVESEIAVNLNKTELEIDNNESSISPIFNLLFRFIPQTLANYMQLAIIFDKDIFFDQKFYDDIAMLSKVNYSRVNETSFGSVSRITSIKPKELIRDLNSLAANSKNFVNTLINLKSFNLLWGIENILQVSMINTFLPMTDSRLRSKTIATMLVSVKASKRLIEDITGVHHDIIAKIYTMYGSHADYRVRKKLSLEKLLNFSRTSEQNAYIILMLSLYVICNRVISNKLPSSNHLDNEDIPSKQSCVIAIGVYKVCEYVRKFIKSQFNIELIPQIPCFDDFYSILTEFSSGKLESVACTKCETPFLDINELYKVVKNRNPRKLCCPCCKESSYYSLQD